ncbi:MAG: HAD-IIB family hydrolase [Patescibacteria group bacterium]
MPIPRLVAFDIDGTLTESKQPVSHDMANLLSRLLDNTLVTLVTGGKLEQITTQIVERLPKGTNMENLYALPTSGAAMYLQVDGGWHPIYEELLSPDEAEHISAVLKSAATEAGIIDFATPSYGERIENRGSQISLSALGQQAPIAEKEAWDPDRSKRLQLQATLTPLLPAYEVRLGGLTTFDVTKRGIDKAYGLKRLSEYLSISIREMLYVGDALFPGGNDEVVKETGIRTKKVANPKATEDFLKILLTNGVYTVDT